MQRQCGPDLSCELEMTVILRIDNVFFNTPDVLGLSAHYSAMLGLPTRRVQEESPGAMWAEISVGGMELSFRRFAATSLIHPHLRGNFLETPPGEGATISFEVADTEAARRHVEKAGGKLVGDPIVCNGGQEIISVFSDPSGRAVQLYEPRFASTAALSVAARHGALAVSSLSESKILPGSNLRGIGGLAYSVAVIAEDLASHVSFYSDLLERKEISTSSNIAVFDLDGSLIEIRSPEHQAALFGGGSVRRRGVTPIIEVHSVDLALHRARHAMGARLNPTPSTDRAFAVDQEGNPVEFWKRP